MSDESTDVEVAADVKYAIFLHEDGTEKERKALDPDNKPYLDEGDNLVIPHGSLKSVKPKQMYYKIWLNEEGTEDHREIRKRGRVPDRAYKDNDGNTVIPYETTKVKAEAVVKTKVYLAKDGSVIDTKTFTKGRLPKRAYVDPNDSTRFFIPWPTDDETESKTETDDVMDESPVIAEQDAPKVERMDIETEAEPADEFELGIVN